MAFICLILFSSADVPFLSFSPSGFVHVQRGGGGMDEWVSECLCEFERHWELGLESGRKAVLINGCCCVSLRLQTRQNCPAQRVLAKLALFILNIYIICVPVQFCATREKLKGACLKFIQVVISFVVVFLSFFSQLSFTASWLVGKMCYKECLPINFSSLCRGARALW